MNSRIVRQTPNMILTRFIIPLSETWHINFILSIWFLHVSYVQMIKMFSLKYTHIMLSTIESAGKWSSLPYIHVNNRLETFNWKMSLIFPLEKWTCFLWRFFIAICCSSYYIRRCHGNNRMYGGDDEDTKTK